MKLDPKSDGPRTRGVSAIHYRKVETSPGNSMEQGPWVFPVLFVLAFNAHERHFVAISVDCTCIETRCVLDWDWNKDTLELSLIIYQMPAALSRGDGHWRNKEASPRLSYEWKCLVCSEE